VGWTLQTQKRAIEGGVSVVMVRGGAPRPFIVAVEGHTGAEEGKRPAVIVLTPLMAGRLDEGLRGESRRGVKTLPGISRLEAGRRGVAGGNEKKRQQSAGGGGR
jgi:hypothetical protein